jgi:dTDP-4-dehydrorhamnose 3,5-epimerase
MSAPDLDAPTLENVRTAGLLPTWDDTRDFIERLRRGG